MTDLTPSQLGYEAVHADIVALLDSARRAAARSVNAMMTATYWSVGWRIVEFEQGGQERAAYGEVMIKRLGVDLSREFGRGFGWRNLAQMRAFYLAWPADQILQTPSAKSAAAIKLQTASGQSTNLSTLAQAFPLPWSAYVRLLSVKNPQARASNEAHYTLEGLSNKVLTAEYRTALPDEKLLAEELDRTRRELEARRIGRCGDMEGGA